jgi:hypothetical protein
VQVQAQFARQKWFARMLVCVLALACATRLSAESAVTKANADFRLGEWTLGMTREQVLAKEDFGPYEPGSSSGVLIARGAKFAEKPASYQLTFGTRGLESVKLTSYEGSDYSAAENAAHNILTMFYKSLDGLDREDFRGPKGAPFPQGDIRRLVKASLGRARDAARSVRAEQGAEILFTFDIAPATQPAGRRILCQLLYVSRTDTYSVVAYEDIAGAPPRNAPANIQLEGGGRGGV